MHAENREPDPTGSFDAIHSRARDALAKSRLAEAEALCLEGLRQYPNHVGLLNLLGQALLGQNRPAEAAKSFSAAIQIDPALANLRFNLALAQQSQGQFDEAIRSVRSAIALDPGVAVLHAKLGQLLSLSNAFAEAAAVLRHALVLDPKSVPVRLNLAQVLTDLGQMVEAMELTRAALYLNPKDATAHRMLGRIHQLNGEFSEASSCFEDSISLQPVQAAAYFALAYSRCLTLGDRSLLDRMEQLLSAPILNESDRVLLHYALGKGLDDLGDFDAAFKHFDRANQISLAARKVAGRTFDADFESKKVDRLIELFPPEAFNQTTVSDGGSDRPIFIVGMVRSGTTLVEQILSRHPDICPGGELRYWIENEPRMHYEWASNPGSAADIDSWRMGYEAELDRVSMSASRITDKMPLNYWSIGLIHLAYPGAKIVHCRRNPRDTCLSIYLTPFRNGPVFAHDLGSIASAYGDYLRLMEHWRSVIPATNLFEVDYEKLVAAPDKGIPELIEFLGLEWRDACLDPGQGSHPINTPSQWQVRQPLYRDSINRWQHYAGRLGPILRLSG